MSTTDTLPTEIYAYHSNSSRLHTPMLDDDGVLVETFGGYVHATRYPGEYTLQLGTDRGEIVEAEAGDDLTVTDPETGEELGEWIAYNATDLTDDDLDRINDRDSNDRETVYVYARLEPNGVALNNFPCDDDCGTCDECARSAQELDDNLTAWAAAARTVGRRLGWAVDTETPQWETETDWKMNNLSMHHRRATPAESDAFVEAVYDLAWG